MPSMVVTLDVSKLSGWLNADARCRVERRACDAGPEVQAGRLGARARAERTENIWTMVVTLDVSKLSGWLNADARCRVERRACDAGQNVGREAGGRDSAVAQAA
eukprot:scaffold2566_cov54-Phaeocystis_antarctica.AAC.1